MQMKVIGWYEDTKVFLFDAISRIQSAAKDSYMWSKSDWWKENNK